ncbi:MAG: LacI family DNA-binding transcriptional regulator [Clostridia bacterium]|nr:LacI family DNA-binding transcriptional regulator [Clostridia bacterium]
MTLKDVALKANCSVATVSKALKNSSEISEEAKQRILTAAKECGYFKKATTRGAVLGGFKTVIFNDVKGNSSELYFDIQKLAKKYGLTAIYVSISEKEALELLSQLGAFGLILKSDNIKSNGEKIFALKSSADEAKDFLRKISNFMPIRPSRATDKHQKQADSNKKASILKNKEKSETASNKTEREKTVEKKEEIWLL